MTRRSTRQGARAILLSPSMRAQLLSLAMAAVLAVDAQTLPAGVQPYVDYWDSTNTVKRSEGLRQRSRMERMAFLGTERTPHGSR